MFCFKKYITFFFFAFVVYSQDLEDVFEIVDQVQKETFEQTKISDSEEIEYGRKIANEIRRTSKVLTNSASDRVSKIGKKLAEYRFRKNLFIQFHLIESREINAFATAGGYVWVTTGILEFVKSEDELAGILGHEIAHIDKKHCQKAIQVYVHVFKYTQDEEISELANIVGLILNQPYSQAQELEADYFGTEYAYKAGYDVSHFANFFERLEKQTNLDKSRKDLDKNLDRLLFSHPLNSTRKEKILKRVLELKKATTSIHALKVNSKQVLPTIFLIVAVASILFMYYKSKKVTHN